MTTPWKSFSVTDVGKKRKVNQDAIYTNDQQQIWLVADGMGGHSDGDKASRAIVNAFSQTKLSDNLAQRLVQIEQVLRLINDELQEYSSTVLNGQHTGSTVVLLTVCQGVCVMVWAGDSRCYRINNGQIKQIGWDHSHVDEMVRAGHITKEEAAHSKLSNVITRAIGAHASVFFDHVIFPYVSDDVFLLCSDGLTNELSDEKIAHWVNTHGNNQSCIDVLLNETLTSGARDNVSIITVASNETKLFNQQEEQRLNACDKAVQHLSESAFAKTITLDDYYQQLIETVSSLQPLTTAPIFNQENAKTQPQQSLKVQELPTNNYPKVTQMDVVKSKLSLKYIVLLTVSVLFSATLVYLILS